MKSLGIDLGGTKIAVAVVEDGKILESTQVPTPQEGFPAVLEAMVGASKPLLAGHPGISAVGVGSPGPLDFDKGTVLKFDESDVHTKMKQDEVVIHIDLGNGRESATAWGCDLTTEYVHINADYRT